MAKRSLTVGLAATTFLASISGYLIADIYDYVPGVFTTKPPIYAQQPAEISSPQFDTILPTETLNDLTPIKNSDLQPIWNELQASTGGKWGAGAYVIDAITGNIVFATNESKPMVPASTTKIFTAYLALTQLNPQTTLKTRLYQEGSTLHLVSEGDLLLGPDEGNPQQTIGRAGLKDLARTALGKSSQAPTDLVIHQKLHDGPALDPQIEQDLRIWISPQTAVAINAGNQGGTYTPEPATAVGNTLAQHFANLGTPVNVTYTDEPYTGETPAAEIESAPISEITRLMLERSDNTLAEHLCRLAAEATSGESTPTAATENLVTTIKKLPIPTDGFNVNACSGLSETNRIAPQTTAEFYYYLWKQGTPPQRQILRMNPISGYSGTLANRLYDDGVAGRIQAKSGLLDTAAALAGIAVTKSGRPLIFHVQTAEVPEGAALTRPDIDKFMEALVNR